MRVGRDDDVLDILKVIDVVANLSGVIGLNTVCIHLSNKLQQLAITTLNYDDVQLLCTCAHKRVLFFGQNQHFDTGTPQKNSTHSITAIADD